MTAEELNAALKALPPSQLEDIPEKNIQRYEELGPIGWHHIMDQIFNSRDVPEKLRRINAQLRLCFATHEKKEEKKDPKKRSKTMKNDKKSIKLDANKRTATMAQMPQVRNNSLQTRVSNSGGSQGNELVNINASDDGRQKNEGEQTNIVKDLLNRDKNQVMGDFSSLIIAKEETIDPNNQAKPQLNAKSETKDISDKKTPSSKAAKA